MGTNGKDMAAEPRLEEEIVHIQKVGYSQAPGPLDKTTARKRHLDNRAPDAEYVQFAGAADQVENPEDFALAPLVDKIAYGIALGLVETVKELKHHIARETRKVGDTVDRRLDTFQTSLQDLSKFVGEQRATNVSMQDRLQQLTVAGAGLQESDARQASELETLRTETTAFSSSVSQRIDTTVAALQESDARQAADLAVLQNETRTLSQSVAERIDSVCKELGVQQEDIAAVTAT